MVARATGDEPCGPWACCSSCPEHGRRCVAATASDLFNPEKLSRIARSSGPHPYSRWALLIFSIFVAEGCFAMACYVAGIRIVYSFAFLVVSLIGFGLWSITTRFWSR